MIATEIHCMQSLINFAIFISLLNHPGNLHICNRDLCIVQFDAYLQKVKCWVREELDLEVLIKNDIKSNAIILKATYRITCDIYLFILCY